MKAWYYLLSITGSFQEWLVEPLLCGLDQWFRQTSTQCFLLLCRLQETYFFKQWWLTFVSWPLKPVLYIKQCFAYEIHLSSYILPILSKKPYVGQYSGIAVQIPLCCCFLLITLQVSYSRLASNLLFSWDWSWTLDLPDFPSAEITGMHHHARFANCSNPTLIH